jgi:hypothetical protein
LAEQLIGEVKKQQQEVKVYQAKLRTATEIIEKMPSEGELWVFHESWLPVQYVVSGSSDIEATYLSVAKGFMTGHGIISPPPLPIQNEAAVVKWLWLSVHSPFPFKI